MNETFTKINGMTGFILSIAGVISLIPIIKKFISKEDDRIVV